jgi:hypothetical protein
MHTGVGNGEMVVLVDNGDSEETTVIMGPRFQLMVTEFSLTNSVSASTPNFAYECLSRQ